MSIQDLAAQIMEGLGSDDSGVGKKVKLDFGDDGCILIDLTATPHHQSPTGTPFARPSTRHVPFPDRETLAMSNV